MFLLAWLAVACGRVGVDGEPAHDAGATDATSADAQASTDAQQPPVGPPPLSVWLRPDDGTTNTGDSPPYASLSNESVPDVLVMEIAERLSVRTWPEEMTLPITIATRRVVCDHCSSTWVIAQPEAALEDRWYVLALAGVPSGVVWSEWQRFVTLTDGAHAVRFRYGSDPTLLRLQFCSIDPTKDYVALSFSENVQATGAYSDVLRVTSGKLAVACELPPYPPTPNWQITATCPTLNRAEQITVIVPAGTLESVSGVPAHDLLGNPDMTVSFVPDALEWAGSCAFMYL